MDKWKSVGCILHYYRKVFSEYFTFSEAVLIFNTFRNLYAFASPGSNDTDSIADEYVFACIFNTHTHYTVGYSILQVLMFTFVDFGFKDR